MPLSLRTTLFPISVYCTVFGFSTLHFDNKSMRELHRIYCFTITVLLFLYTTTVLLNKLYNMEANFVSVLFFIADTASIFAVTYYRFTFILSENVLGNILNNLDYVDKCLDKIGVKVCHAKDLLVCWAGFTLILLYRTGITYIFVRSVQYPNTHHEFALEFASFFNNSVKYLLTYSVFGLQSYLLVTLFILKRRLVIFRRTITSFNYFRNTAWSATSDRSCRRVSISNKPMLLNTLYTMYGSLNKVYYDMEELCKYYFCLKLLIFSTVSSVFIAFTPIFNQNIYFFLFLLRAWGFPMLSIGLPILVTLEISNIKKTIFNIYYHNNISNVNTKIIKWVRLSTNTEETFDCGYFVVDYAVFSYAFNLSILFLFAIIH